MAYQGRLPDGVASRWAASQAAAEAIAAAAGSPRRQRAAFVPVSRSRQPSPKRVRSVVDRTIWVSGRGPSAY